MTSRYDDIFAESLDALKAENRYRYFVEIERLAGRHPVARWHAPDGPRDVIVWCSNDYLGTVVGIVSATSFVGDGANISNVPYTSLTGVTTNIVADTTPQLGGDLDLNSQNITGTGNANITGVVTATSFKGDGSGLTKVFSAVNFILS